jgi:hypothetical protein
MEGISGRPSFRWVIISIVSVYCLHGIPPQLSLWVGVLGGTGVASPQNVWYFWTSPEWVVALCAFSLTLVVAFFALRNLRFVVIWSSVGATLVYLVTAALVLAQPNNDPQQTSDAIAYVMFLSLLFSGNAWVPLVIPPLVAIFLARTRTRTLTRTSASTGA